MDEKKRFNQLIRVWKRSGIKNLEDEKLDFFKNELKRFKNWNRRDRIQQKQINNLAKKFNDRLEEILRKKGVLK